MADKFAPKRYSLLPQMQVQSIARGVAYCLGSLGPYTWHFRPWTLIYWPRSGCVGERLEQAWCSAVTSRHQGTAGSCHGLTQLRSWPVKDRPYQRTNRVRIE